MNTLTRIQDQRYRLTDVVMFLSLVMIFFVIFFVQFLEQELIIPVQDASTADWNRDSFWYEPWGASGVHKGIDIFAPRGTNAIAAISGIVIYKNELKLGGKVMTILGPKWQLHYYAHLDSIEVNLGDWVQQGDRIGTVGNTGNALNKQPHLHYTILSLIPDPVRYNSQTQGWKQMFYLNPDKHLPR